MKQNSFFLTALLLCIANAFAFTLCSKNNCIRHTSTSSVSQHYARVATRIASVENDESTEAPAEKKTLEEKMAGWEASEEEIKAATLGGMTPGKGTDGFDIGLYIAFPIIVATSLLFAVFPFIMDKIDVSSVGPPPTV